MGGYELPTSLEVGGREYEIRSDYRAVLDVMAVMADPDIDGEERAVTALYVFYPDLDDMPAGDLEEAVGRMHWFINGGTDERSSRRRPRLMDWEQDFPLIVSPVNRVMGREVRAMDYLHWWTFLSAYREIGDCLFAQVVGIRRKLSQGRKLDKGERRFYDENRDIVDLRKRLTEEEEETLRDWIT